MALLDRQQRKVRIIADPRKKITLGYKTEKGYPKSANHFVLQNPVTKEEYFPELIKLYGTEPTKFFISFPTDNYEDFYSERYNLYGSNNALKRSCNGVECVHYCDSTIEKVKYGTGEITDCVCREHNLFETENKELKKLKCGFSMHLTAYILHPETKRLVSPMCYLFNTGSINTADNLYSELQRYNKFVGYPFCLEVKEVKKADGTVYRLLILYPYLDANKLIDYNTNASIRLNEVLGTEPIMIEENNVVSINQEQAEQEALDLMNEEDEEDENDEAIQEADYETVPDRELTQQEYERFLTKLNVVMTKMTFANSDMYAKHKDTKTEQFKKSLHKATDYIKLLESYI